eukprot:g5520.t1
MAAFLMQIYGPSWSSVPAGMGKVVGVKPTILQRNVKADSKIVWHVYGVLSPREKIFGTGSDAAREWVKSTFAPSW